MLVDHDRNSATAPITQYVMPNVAPDAGFSASYNSLFTMFGQFFDHGLDLAAKGGSGTVFVPLQPDDPLYDPTSQTNFMVLTRATNQPGDDGVLGTADDVKDATNLVTPYIDNNQTYTSHPSHQVFLREYRNGVAGNPVVHRPPARRRRRRPAHVERREDARPARCSASSLQDTDVTNVPLIATDAYGKFILGAAGYPQLVLKNGTMVEGNPTLARCPPPGSTSCAAATPSSTTSPTTPRPACTTTITTPATPPVPMVPDADIRSPSTTTTRATYDDEMLGAHYITGDGRGNENIGLTAMHHIFHQEHNGLVQQLETFIPTLPANSPAALPAWKLGDGSWNGERIFQAAKLDQRDGVPAHRVR